MKDRLICDTVSWGRFIPRQKYKKTIPGKILKLGTVLGLSRSGKAKKVDVSLRPREIMAKNQITPNCLKWTLITFIYWPWKEFWRVHKTQKGVPSDSGWWFEDIMFNSTIICCHVLIEPIKFLLKKGVKIEFWYKNVWGLQHFCLPSSMISWTFSGENVPFSH